MLILLLQQQLLLLVFFLLFLVFLFALLFVLGVLILEEAEVVASLSAANIDALLDLWHFGVNLAINIVIFRIEVPTLRFGDGFSGHAALTLAPGSVRGALSAGLEIFGRCGFWGIGIVGGRNGSFDSGQKLRVVERVSV